MLALLARWVPLLVCVVGLVGLAGSFARGGHSPRRMSRAEPLATLPTSCTQTITNGTVYRTCAGRTQVLRVHEETFNQRDGK